MRRDVTNSLLPRSTSSWSLEAVRDLTLEDIASELSTGRPNIPREARPLSPAMEQLLSAVPLNTPDSPYRLILKSTLHYCPSERYHELLAAITLCEGKVEDLVELAKDALKIVRYGRSSILRGPILKADFLQVRAQGGRTPTPSSPYTPNLPQDPALEDANREQEALQELVSGQSIIAVIGT